MSDPDGQSTPSPLVFPTDYPIKVVGRSERGFKPRVDAVVLHDAPDLTADRISERASGAGNFISITYVVWAQSREQITALVGALIATEGVLMVI